MMGSSVTLVDLKIRSILKGLTTGKAFWIGFQNALFIVLQKQVTLSERQTSVYDSHRLSKTQRYKKSKP